MTNFRSTANGWWLIPSAVAVFTINLWGFPAASHSSDVQMILDIYDSQDSFVSRCEALGKGTAYVAIYWGYIGSGMWVKDDMPVLRAAHSKAVGSAIESIKKQLVEDAPMIRERLLRATGGE